MDMHVVARTDPHAVREEVRPRIPTGFRRRAAGEPRRHWANPELWVTCALGPYNFDFMNEVHREIVAKYPVDGIFANRWAPQGGDCFCVHCQQNFKAATGRDLPRADGSRAIRPRAGVPRMAQGAPHRAVEAVGRDDPRVNPDARFIPNGPPDLKTAGELARHPVHGQPGAPRPDAAVGERAAREGVPIGHGPAADRRHLQRRARGAVSLEGLRAERARDAAVGGGRHGQRHAAWVTKFSGVLYDRRWLPIVERIYQWHFAHERYLRNEMPLARVALLHSEQTADVSCRRRRRAIGTTITCSACTTRSSRRACRSSWFTRRSSRPSGSTRSSC